MPPLSRRFLKTAIAFGVLGVLTGIHMSTAQHLGAGSMHRFYISAHTHIMLVGLFTMAAMGVALWKLPAAPTSKFPRAAMDTLAYWLITLGTLVRFTLESWIGYLNPEPTWMHQGINAFSTLQGLGLILFLVNQWPRIRGGSE